MTILGAIGDVTRFPCAKQLVGYAGLGAGVHDSGKSHRDKGITKQGRRDLRFSLVEAARVAVQTHPYWKHQFAQLAKRSDEHKAGVALARKLLIVVWHVLLAKSADRRADAEQVAFKLMVWSWTLTDEQRGGMTSRQFIRVQLMRLGLGDGLRHITPGERSQCWPRLRKCWHCSEIWVLQCKHSSQQSEQQAPGSGFSSLPQRSRPRRARGERRRCAQRLSGGCAALTH